MECSTVIFLVLLTLQFGGGETTSCPNTSATADTKPLYLLTLTSFTHGLRVLSGARVARDEINNRTDLLSGYHIELIVDDIELCSALDAGIGLSNLVKYTVSPPCRPVVAVNGLGCSSQTSLLSPVAGHDGYDLIQLSAANSPIFQTQNYRFPRLFRFLGSAAVYSDTILAIMDQYNWNRIGVVYNADSVFSSEIAIGLEQKVKASSKIIAFILGIRKTKEFYLDAAISNINNQETTILVSILSTDQENALLSRVTNEMLIYPEYIWIHVEDTPKNLEATRGHIYLHTQTSLESDTVLVSKETYAEFRMKHKQDIKLIERQYKRYDLKPTVFAGFWYDQVWAIALAVNKSLPVLENRNLFIDNYTIGQHEITDVIEEQMANLSFQGAGGRVEFNQYHSVSTPVEIYWVTDNGSVKQVGLFDPNNRSNLSISIKKSKLPNDRPPHKISIIPLPVAIVLSFFSRIVVLLISLQLALFLYYRNHKTIKATSPHLSILVFIGCYLSCLASVFTIGIGSIGYWVISTIATLLFLLANGISLILVTITIRLLRVYRIFFFTERQNIGKCWKNGPLILIVLSISFIPNLFILFFDVSLITQSISIGLIGGYLSIFLFIILFFAFRTRKIKYEDFKDTKTITYFIAIMIITITVGTSLTIILAFTGNLPASYIMLAMMALVISAACQLCLFTPKLVRIVFEKCFPGVDLPLFSITTTQPTTMTTEKN